MNARRALLLAVLVGSGLGDVGGGLWALMDWRGAARFMARTVPDWHAQNSAAGIAFADAALRQLWANLGSALVALGLVQLMSAIWILRGQTRGFAVARLVAWTLIVAGGLVALFGEQTSALLSESTRGLVILALVAWARPAEV